MGESNKTDPNDFPEDIPSAFIERSHVKGDIRTWVAMRRFLANLVDRDGSILDVGCSNGLLLKCLQLWSGFTLVPFGIDIDEKSVSEARHLFPEFSTHFVAADVETLNLANLPRRQFDIIYWNVWDNWKFKKENEWALLGQMVSAVRPQGRLILGFYGKDLGENLNRVRFLSNSGFRVNGSVRNGRRSEIAAWFDSQEPQTPGAKAEKSL